MQILNSGVGPITEADISQAVSTGATIIGFDVPCTQQNGKKAEVLGVSIRLHKLIYKFTGDLEDIIHDVKQEELLAGGEGNNRKVLGTGTILEVFQVTQGKQKVEIYGSKVLTGELQARQKYRVVRDDEVVADELTLHTLKHHKKTVS